MGYQLLPSQKGKEPQLKDEHPMQEIWDQIEEEENARVVAWPDGKQERIVPPVGPGGIVPIPRVDYQLIGKEYR